MPPCTSSCTTWFPPTRPIRPPTEARPSRSRSAVLIALNALARLLTAWILLKIRRPGPGLWWSAVCVTSPWVRFSGPFGVVAGRALAGPGLVGPATWGLLLLAIEMLLLHRAYNEGRRRALYGLVRCSCSGRTSMSRSSRACLILAAAAIGRVLDGPWPRRSSSRLRLPIAADKTAAEPSERPRVRPVGLMAGLVVLVLCVAACLVNPSTLSHLLRRPDPVLQLFGPATDFITLDQLSYFGKASASRLRRLVLVHGFLPVDGRRWDWARSC